MRILTQSGNETAEENRRACAARRNLVCILLLGTLIAGTVQVFGRQQTQSGSTVQTPEAKTEAPHESDVETVYVTVLDKKGNPVTDLKHEDFSVSENQVPQEIVEVTSAGEAPMIIAVAVDVSGSMHSEKFRREQMQAFVNFFSKTLQGSDRAFLVMFGERAARLTGLTNSPVELQAGLEKIAEARRYGGTALYDCLISAAETMPQGAERRRVILVMSDFEDNVSRNSLQITVPRIQETRTAVYPLVDTALLTNSKRFRKQALETADAIARESGGAGYAFEKPGELDKALEQIRIVLRNSYAVKYHASGQTRKDISVGVKIAVQREGAKVVAPSTRFPAAR